MFLDGLILVVFSAVLATPIVFLACATQDDLPKLVYLLWGTFLLAALVFLRNLSLRRWAFPSKPLLLAIALFAAMRGAGAAFSPSLDAALLDLALLAACVVVAVLVLLDRPIADFLEQRGLPILVLVGAAVSALGVLQHFGVDLVRGEAERAAVGTLGNPSFAGALAAALLPLALGLAVAPCERPLRIAMLASAPFLLTEAVLSGSRGAWLGGLAGLAIFGGFFLFGRVPPQLRQVRRTAAAVAAVFLLVTLGLGATTEVGKRFRVLLSREAASREVRPSLWAGAIRMTRDRPWTGHGTGGFAPAYVAYRDPGEAHLSGNASQVEEPHCEPLRIAAENGVPGVIAGALLLLAAAAGARHALARGTALRPHLVAVGIIASLASLFAFGLVNPLASVPSLALVGWVLLAALGSLRTIPKGETRVYRPSRAGLLACALPALAGLGGLALFATSLLHDDLLFREGFAAVTARDGSRAERVFRLAAPSDPRARHALAEVYRVTGDPLRGAAQARAEVAECPWDAHAWTMLGQCEGMQEHLDEAERAYLEAARLAPAYANARQGLAAVYRFTGRAPEAEEQQRLYEEILRKEGVSPK